MARCRVPKGPYRIKVVLVSNWPADRYRYDIMNGDALVVAHLAEPTAEREVREFNAIWQLGYRAALADPRKRRGGRNGKA
jgi:hypothetical protein